MKLLKRTSISKAFTLVEIMIVVLIIGVLLAIAIPNFVAARETSRAKACVGNLKEIDSAVQQCAMDNKLSATDTSAYLIDGLTPTTPETTPGSGGSYQLVGPDGYIRATPVCPEGGTYVMPTTPEYEPVCTVSGAAAGLNGLSAVSGTETGTDYLYGGKWYHGLAE